MAATTAQSGKGSTLSYGDSASGPWTAIAEVKEMNGGGVSVAFEEATHYTSDNSYTEQISLGWESAKPITFTVNYAKAATATLYALIDTAKYWKQSFPDGGNWIQQGRISDFGGAPVPNKGVITNTMTITPVGSTAFATT